MNPPAWLRGSAQIYSTRAVAAAAPWLEEVEDLLRGDRPAARGVALTHQLLVDGSSPLHGSDGRRLCEELRRIVVVLQDV